MLNAEEFSLEKIFNLGVKSNIDVTLPGASLLQLYSKQGKNTLINDFEQFNKNLTNLIGEFPRKDVDCLKLINTKKGKVLTLCKEQLITNLFDALNAPYQLSIFKKNDEDIIKELKSIIRFKKSELDNVISVNQLEKLLPQVVNEMRKSNYHKDSPNSQINLYSTCKNSSIVFNKFKEYLKNQLTKLSLNLKYGFEFADREISFQILNSIDKEKLLLYISKVQLDYSRSREKANKKVDNNIYAVMNYALLKECNSNNLVLNGQLYYKDNISGKINEIKNYSLRDFFKEYRDYVIDHKNIKQEIVNLSNLDSYTVDQINEYLELYRDTSSFILQTNWEIIPNGENKTTREYVNHNGKTVAKLREYRDVFMEKRVFFDNSSYAYMIQGKDKFIGYRGYIYTNGNVIFEKIYDNLEETKESKNEGIYIMNIFNFVEFSKLSKSEIMQYIKNNNSTEIKRHYHVKGWENTIKKYIDEKTNVDKNIIDIMVLKTLQKVKKKD